MIKILIKYLLCSCFLFQAGCSPVKYSIAQMVGEYASKENSSAACILTLRENGTFFMHYNHNGGGGNWILHNNLIFLNFNQIKRITPVFFLAKGYTFSGNYFLMIKNRKTLLLRNDSISAYVKDDKILIKRMELFKR